MPLLNTAAAVRVGALTASRVYRGSSLVWEAGGGPAGPGTKYYCHAEGATDGAAVSTADTFGTPWSSAANLVYTSDAKVGTRGIKPTSTTAATGSAQWHNDTPVTSVAFGFWLKWTALPAVDIRFVDLRQTSSAGSVGGLVMIGATNKIQVVVNSGITTPGASPALTAGVWYWVTMHWDATAKTTRFRIYTDATTVFHDSGELSASASTFADLAVVRFVRPTSASHEGVFDNFAYDPGASDTIPPWLT